MLEPQIVEKPALSVIGLEATFINALSPDATNFQVIGPLWDRFINRAGEVPNRTGDAMVGIVYGRPEAERAHPHEAQYLAAAPVSAVAAELPEGMVSRTLPPGAFAVFTHRGPISTISETVNQIHRAWLPQSAYEHSGIADVELYDQRFRGNSEDSEMEYWVSVTRKAGSS